MSIQFIIDIFHEFVVNAYGKAEEIWPMVIAAVIILSLWAIISYGIYKFSIYIFKRFGIVELIDSLWEGFEENTTKIVDTDEEDKNSKKKSKSKAKKESIVEKRIHKPVPYDRIFSKATSYYVFLLFFRWAIVILWVTEVETFMNDLIGYLPSLFVGIMIGFFGLRFANSVYDIIYQALELTRDKTSMVIAMWAKIIIMFFTLMIMLHYIKIVDQFIINTLFLGFITTLTLGISLAFGIGGKDIAREILEGFKK